MVGDESVVKGKRDILITVRWPCDFRTSHHQMEGPTDPWNEECFLVDTIKGLKKFDHYETTTLIY